MAVDARTSSRQNTDHLAQIRDTATAANLPFTQDENTFSVGIKNGRDYRELEFENGAAKELASIPFDRLVFLGDYDAWVNIDTGEIEARITSAVQRPIRYLLRSIPGAETLATEPGALPEFRLVVERANSRIEISTSSSDLQSMIDPRGSGSTYNGYSIRIQFGNYTNSDEVVAYLKSIASAFFFELDVRYRVCLALQSRLTPRKLLLNPSRNVQRASFPEYTYPAIALDLYRYGRGANRLPLLEFLAYYQAAEYYFPIHSRRQVLRQVRNQLVDPAFNRNDEHDIARLVDVANGGNRRGPTEREQLRATVEFCLDVPSVRRLVESGGKIRDHFARKDSPIIGAIPLKPGSDEFLNQIADRLYAIRCRIVHTKLDGGESGTELLLPSGKEASQLGPDIDLMRFVAQRAISASGSPLEVRLI